MDWYNLKGYDPGMDKAIARKLAKAAFKQFPNMSVRELAYEMIDLSLSQREKYDLRVLAWAADRLVNSDSYSGRGSHEL
jgi:hypothetical protein